MKSSGPAYNILGEFGGCFLKKRRCKLETYDISAYETHRHECSGLARVRSGYCHILANDLLGIGTYRGLFRVAGYVGRVPVEDQGGNGRVGGKNVICG